MTRKHFVAMAAALRTAQPAPPAAGDRRFTTAEAEAAYDQWQEDVSRVADVLATTNPSFDRGRFWTACHGEIAL